MIQQSRKVIQLLADCQYEEAVLDLERMLMDKQTVDTAWMDQIPDLYKQNAPMLLKYQGELWLRQGKLSQAESVFRAAAQGFATQTFQTMLLDVLAYLAVLHMRIGQWSEARSLLLFLNGEWTGGECRVSGHVLHALALGAHLLPEEARYPSAFTAAWNRFIEDGDIQGAMRLGLDRVMFRGFTLEASEQERILLYMEQKAKLAPVYKPMWLLASAVCLKRRGDLQEALLAFKSVETEQLSYEYTSSCFIWHLALCIRAGDPVGPAEWQSLERIVNQYETDLDVQFQAGAVLYKRASLDGNHKEAKRWLTRLRDWEQLTRNPMYTAWLKQLGEMEIEAKPDNKPFEKKGWTISCFGKMRFVQGGTELIGLKWKRKKALELFAYLLIQPGLSAAKEQVMEALLGPSNLLKMGNQLYVIVHQLKQTLRQELNIDPGVFVRDGWIRLNEDLLYSKELDQYYALIQTGDRLWESDRAISLELYEQAVQMYGPFLPEVRYTDWIHEYRERMDGRQAVILQKLANHALEQKQFERAAQYLRRKVELFPLEEDGYRELVRLLHHAGDKKEARRWMKKWEKVRSAESIVAPEEESHAYKG